jgi:hypothetical protein
MPARVLAHSVLDRLALLGRRGAQERSRRTTGAGRSALVTATHVLVMAATSVGYLRGLLRRGRVSPRRGKCPEKRVA